MTEDPQRQTNDALAEAVAGERERIAKLLHDELVQTVSAAAMRVELIRAVDDADANDLSEAQEAMRTATVQLRAIMDGLRRPPAGA
jgi:signal transduction histidine kinase